MSLSLDSFVAIPISPELYNELSHRYPSRASSVIEHIVQDFLDRTAEDFEATLPTTQGIHWDSVFLPDGTQVRTKYYGNYHVAEIANSQIVFDGNNFPSMSKLASTMRGNTSNNAWMVLELKRPTDATWQPANRLRR